VGSSVIASLAYLGGLASLMLSAAVSPLSFSRDGDAPGFWSVMKGELGWLLMMGFPLVGLVHVGMGSFLSMQAYFGSTFVDGTGAVVGVGLLRNVASLVTGMTLSGLIACRIIPDRLGMRHEIGEPESSRLGPTVFYSPRDSRGDSQYHGQAARARQGHGQAARATELRPSRETAPRLAASAVATMLLSLWGFAVGTVIGWQSAGALMGLSSNMYFLMFYQMIWFRDVVGLIVKGLFFGLVTAAICCYEALHVGSRRLAEATPESRSVEGTMAMGLAGPIVRAACLSMVAILVLNMTWFILVYHAVPVYGPSLLQPPSP
jgi:phospholipid/cholesterol/gamma-HCH transport system permease protein